MGDGRYFRMGLLAAFLAGQGACVGHDDACGGPTSDFPYCGDDEGPVNDSPGEGDGVTGGGGSPPPGAGPGGGMDAGSAADPDDSAADGGVAADGGPDAAVGSDCGVDEEGGVEDGGVQPACEATSDASKP